MLLGLLQYTADVFLKIAIICTCIRQHYPSVCAKYIGSHMARDQEQGGVK